MKTTLKITHVMMLAALATAPFSYTAFAAGENSPATGDSTRSDAADASMWKAENTYWRSNYASRPYYNDSRNNYRAYEPAYRYGYDMYMRNPGKSYDELNQSELSSGWSKARNKSKLSWEHAEGATRDAYTRMHESGTIKHSGGAN